MQSSSYTYTLTQWSDVGQRMGPLLLPCFLLNCLHSCQSNSVCSIISFRLGELSTQLPWPVSTGGLLLYQQVCGRPCSDTFAWGCFSWLWLLSSLLQFGTDPFLLQYVSIICAWSQVHHFPRLVWKKLTVFLKALTSTHLTLLGRSGIPTTLTPYSPLSVLDLPNAHVAHWEQTPAARFRNVVQTSLTRVDALIAAHYCWWFLKETVINHIRVCPYILAIESNWCHSAFVTHVLWVLFILLLILFCRDVLPFPLQLPEAIVKATTHRQLEAISHMGQGTVTLGLTLDRQTWVDSLLFHLP